MWDQHRADRSDPHALVDDTVQIRQPATVRHTHRSLTAHLLVQLLLRPLLDLQQVGHRGHKEDSSLKLITQKIIRSNINSSGKITVNSSIISPRGGAADRPGSTAAWWMSSPLQLQTPQLLSSGRGHLLSSHRPTQRTSDPAHCPSGPLARHLEGHGGLRH